MATTSCHSLKLVARPLQGRDPRQMGLCYMRSYQAMSFLLRVLSMSDIFIPDPVWSEVRLSMGTQHANITAGVKTNWVH